MNIERMVNEAEILQSEGNIKIMPIPCNGMGAKTKSRRDTYYVLLNSNYDTLKSYEHIYHEFYHIYNDIHNITEPTEQEEVNADQFAKKAIEYIFYQN